MVKVSIVTRHCTDSHRKRTSSICRVHETRASLRISQFYLWMMHARTVPQVLADNTHHCADPAPLLPSVMRWGWSSAVMICRHLGYSTCMHHLKAKLVYSETRTRFMNAWTRRCSFTMGVCTVSRDTTGAFPYPSRDAGEGGEEVVHCLPALHMSQRSIF